MERFIDARMRLLERCLTGVRPQGPPYSPDALADAWTVRVSTATLEAPVDGLTLDAETVLLSGRLSEPERRFTLAHELGHVAVRRGFNPTGTWDDEEQFADAFARELLLPHREAREPTASATDLALTYVLPTCEAIAQLQIAGRVGPLVSDGCGRVLCIRCGTRSGQLGCSCLRFRQRSNLSLPSPEFAATA